MPTLDVSQHHTFFHNTETVTFTAVRDTGDTETTVEYALRRQLNRSDVTASVIEITGSEIVWNLPVAELSTEPQRGDTITDSAGVVWTVMSWQKQTFGTRWRIIAIRERGNA
jgi:hypothetical protein